ncbi:MAG: hypothetical protein ACI8VW_002817 [bacterium]|jgi:hypothetical protein
MKLRLFRAGIVVALALQPLQSRAHESVLAHSHEGYGSASVIGLSIVSVLLLIARRSLKR